MPVEPGFSYHSESNMDLMQDMLSELAGVYTKLHLPLRSIENEWGPGQLECTFAARPALEAADHAMLFRTATRQICRRMGYFATFMARPALKSYYSSGWHLHQSLVDGNSGRNLFMPEREGDCLSPLGRAAKVHSSWPGPHSFSIERSGRAIFSNASASAESTGCIKSMLDSE